MADDSAETQKKLWGTYWKILQDRFGNEEDNFYVGAIDPPMSANWGEAPAQPLSDGLRDSLNLLSFDLVTNPPPEPRMLAVAAAPPGNKSLDSLSSNDMAMDDFFDLMNQPSEDAQSKKKEEVAALEEKRDKPAPVKPEAPPAGGTRDEILKRRDNIGFDYHSKVGYLPVSDTSVLHLGNARLSDAYYSVLSDIRLGLKPDGADAIKTAFDKYKESKISTVELRKGVVEEYTTYKQQQAGLGLPIDPADKWMLDNGWTNRVRAAQDTMDASFAEFRQVLQAQNYQEDLVAAIVKADQRNPQLFELDTLERNSIHSDQIVWATQEKPVFESRFESVETHDSTTTRSGSAGVSYFGLFNVSSDGSRTEESHDSQGIDISYHHYGQKQLKIATPDWYNQVVLAKYAVGKGADVWSENSPFRQSNPFELPAGLFWGFPATVYLAYKPGFTLKMSQEHSLKITTHVAAGGGLRVGPWRFGGHGSSSSVKTDTSGQNVTITCTNPSNEPQIVAMGYERLKKN